MKNYDLKKVWALVGPVALAGLNQQLQVVRDPNALFWMGVATLAVNHFIDPLKRDGESGGISIGTSGRF